MDSISDATLAPQAMPSSSLAGRARLAVAWATGLQFFRDVLQFGLMLVLVRLLPAEAYGQFGLITTLLTFFTAYSFREFLSHTLQVRTGVVHYQDHFTAGAIVQGIIFVLVNATAVGFRWLPDYAPVAPVLHVMSALFLLDLPAELRTKMLERELDWRRLRMLQGLGVLVAAASSLVMALAGWGVWALIVPTMVVPLPFIYDLFIAARWRPTWAFAWARFQPAWRFGLARFVTLTFLAVASLTESLTLASALGFAMLGIFGRAIGLAQLLCGRLAGLLALAIYPVLTRVTPSSHEFRRAGALYLRAVAWVVIPAAAVTSVLAEPIVRLLYGDKWLDAIPLVPWAMAGAAVAALVQTSYTVLLANGEQRACVAADGWRMAGVLLALLLALPFGPARYLAVLCAVQVVSLILISTLLWRSKAMSEPALFEALAPACVSAIAAVVAILGVRAALGQVPPIWDTAVVGATFGLVYVGALRAMFRRPLAEVVGQLPQSLLVARALRLD